MSIANYAGFDPYQQWLGIPPHEQPPNYYRLLGMPLFEQDMYQIAGAADQLLQFFQGITDPQFAPAASRLYEEVYSARVSLTDPYRKSQYDAWLQQNQGYQQPAQNYQQPPVQSYQQPANQSYQQPPVQNYQQANQGYQQPPVQSYQQPPVQSYQQPPVQSYQPPVQDQAYQQPPVQDQGVPQQPAAQDAGPAPLYPPGFNNGASSSPEAPPQQDNYSSPPQHAAYEPQQGTGQSSAPQPQTGYAGVGYSQPNHNGYQAPASDPSPGYGQTGDGSTAVGAGYGTQPDGNGGSGTYAAGGSGTYGASTVGGSGTYGTHPGGSGTYGGIGSGTYGASAPTSTIPPEPQPAPNSAPDSVEMAAAGWQVGGRHPAPSSGEELPPVRRKPHTMVALAGGAILFGILAVVIARNLPSSAPPRRTPVAQQTVKPTAQGTQSTKKPVDRPPPVVTPADPEPGVEPTDPEPAVEPTPEPKSEPTDPEPVVVEPKTEPKSEPTEPPKTVEPEPQPEPEPIVLDPAVAADVKQKLGGARLAMAQRDLSLARERLEPLKSMKLPEQEARELARLSALVGHLEIFWNQAVKSGLESLKDTDEIMVKEKPIAVVEATESRLILRMSGRNKTYFVDSMPTVLVMFLANRWFKPVASSKVYIGAFYAMDHMGDREEARRLWQAARREGAGGEKDAVDLIMPELDVPLPETTTNLIPK